MDHAQGFYKAYNQTAYPHPTDTTMMALFKDQVERTPDAIAVVFKDQFLTYREVDGLSNQVAHMLIANGVEGNAIVGVSLLRSLSMIVAIYGILKAGAAYLPISTETPEKRLEYLIEDSGIDIIITAGPRTGLQDNTSVKWLCVEEGDLAPYPKTQPSLSYSPSDMMYVIYTSGSTGKPKGVAIEHHTLVNRLLWMQRAYPISGDDAILQKTPFVFDVSVWELFWWALVGARVIMLEPGHERFPKAILTEIKRCHVTTMHFVPSMFNMFLGYLEETQNLCGLESLKYIFCSGEKLHASYVNRFNQLFAPLPDLALVNLYGPTEATVDVTHYQCPRDQVLETVPIGKPIDNVEIYVVKDNQLALPGEEGELLLAGRCLARCYINKEELTLEKFSDSLAQINQRYYHTGDIVKILEDGNIEYLTRHDFQVKIRGLRIELGEIEHHAMAYGGVSDCHVLVKNMESLNPILVAFLVAQEGTEDKAVKQYLTTQLPPYMVPTKYVFLDKMPLTSNGKVDRGVLWSHLGA